MKKTLMIVSVIVFILLTAFSASALEDAMTNTSLISTADGYTFECVINPNVTGEYMPVLAAYDSNDVLCGIMFGDTVSVTSGTVTVETFKVNIKSTPSLIKLMFLKTDGSYAPVCKFEQVPTALNSEKYGMITKLDGSNGVYIFSTDGSYAPYTLSDDVILSHGNTVVFNKASALSYIDSLKFNYYTKAGEASSLWEIFKNDISCYKDQSGSASQTYTSADFSKNYAKRVVRFLATSDKKITSLSFADDTLYKKISSTDTLTSAFYTLSSHSFNDKHTINNDAKVLYLPARDGVSDNDYAVKSPSNIKNGNHYHGKIFTSSNGGQIVLLTYMYTDAELTKINTNPKKHINVALNGNGGTYKGIKNYTFNITLSAQSAESNDKANIAANLAMDYVAIGLQGALDAANDGYAITPEFVKIRFASEISAARQQINIIKQLDETLSLSPGYYGELENQMPLAIGNEAVSFLKNYFLN